MKVETKETMREKGKALDNSVDAKAQVPNYCGELRLPHFSFYSIFTIA